MSSDPWTEEEDRRIIEAKEEYGNKWTEIGKLFPGRTANSVRHRWYSKLYKREVFEGVPTLPHQTRSGQPDSETRSRGKEEAKQRKVRKWEKKWITIHDTTMKIYKWVPIIEERKKKSNSSNKENRYSGCENSSMSFAMTNEDSNTSMSAYMYATGENSQDATDFSASHFNMSEDSNSEPPFKKKLEE